MQKKLIAEKKPTSQNSSTDESYLFIYLSLFILSREKCPTTSKEKRKKGKKQKRKRSRAIADNCIKRFGCGTRQFLGRLK